MSHALPDPREVHVDLEAAFAQLLPWLHNVVAGLVERPAGVSVAVVSAAGPTAVLALTVAESDVGRLIGRSGSNIGALQALASSAGGRRGLRIVLVTPQAHSEGSRRLAPPSRPGLQ